MARPRSDERPLPARPFRDSAAVYGVLAATLVVVAVVIGSEIGRAIVGAGIFFVLATGWSWWSFRRRIRSRSMTPAAQSPAPSGAVSAAADPKKGNE